MADEAGSAVAEDRPNASKLRGYLDRRMRVTMSDGRVIMGRFMSVDDSKTIVLCKAELYKPLEEALKESMEEKKQRMLDLALIPGDHVVKCEVDAEPYPYE